MPTPEFLRMAIARRAGLKDNPATTAFRWVNGEGDGAPGITVDGFDDVLVVSLYVEKSEAEERALVDALAERLSPRAIYLKRRPREARVVATTRKEELAPEAPVYGPEVDELEVKENGLHFVIRPGQGLSVGLYLDMRSTRAFLRQQVAGKSVLNCFAYTCAFGVYALAGGAARAVNLDLSRRVLDWGMVNLRRNHREPSARDFISGDCFEWLRRFAKKGETFDVVILDPPSFATSRSSRFSAGSDYPDLVAAAAPVIASGGMLLACSNLASLSASRFASMVDAGLAKAGRTGKIESRLGASTIDFPPEPGSAPALKVLAVRVS